MSNFLDVFSKALPRETAGARSANRFDYQKSWALCELLELHHTRQDYLLVFEHHEDIVVLDSSVNPQSAKFYQVKTKTNSNWTLNNLCKKGSSPTDLSVLGKLFANNNEFDDNVEALVFASNRGLSTKLSCGQKGIVYECVEFAQLVTEDKKKVWETVKADNNDYCDINALTKLKILRSALQPEDHVSASKGRLADFFEIRHPHQPIQVSLAHKTISDEIKRKSNYELIPKNPSELLRNKSISRDEFESILKIVSQAITPDELWIEAVQALTAEGFNFLEQRKIKNEWHMYSVERMNAANEYIQIFRKTIREFVVHSLKNETFTTLCELLEQSKVHTKQSSVGQDSSEEFINAATIYELFTYDQLSKTNPKFEEQAK